MNQQSVDDARGTERDRESKMERRRERMRVRGTERERNQSREIDIVGSWGVFFLQGGHLRSLAVMRLSCSCIPRGTDCPFTLLTLHTTCQGT